MNLYGKLPDTVQFEGVEYRLDLSFQAVLAAFDLLDDGDLSDSAQIKGALDILVLSKHPESSRLLGAISKIIAPERPQAHHAPVIDFNQDWAYIYAGFVQAYGIDLFTVKDLHWLKFHALLKSLPRSTRMAEIMDIRARPLPRPTPGNAEERAQLLKLKAEYAIRKPSTAENGLRSLFEALKSQAETR